MLRYKIKERLADREFAERRRITIREIAESTGITRNTLSRLINKFGVDARAENIDRLCAYFQCRIEELVEHVPDRVPSRSPRRRKTKPVR